MKRSREQIDMFRSHLDEITGISNGVVHALGKEDDEGLGLLMNRNHELLCQIGVSTPVLDSLVVEARKAGALGAKLTGAGGGGCIIALCDNSKDRSNVAKRLRKVGGTIYDVSLDEGGVN